MVTRRVVAVAVLAAAVASEAAVTESVVASSFGFNTTNATKCLQAALDSGARRVVVDRQASDWIVDPLYVRSDTEVVFEDGVIVRARPGGFKKTGDCLFRANRVKNVSFLGRGRAILSMPHDDYLDASRYTPSQFRMAIHFESAQNVRVADLIIRGSGGDAVYVDGVTSGVVERVTTSDNMRQGCSVVSASHLVIRDCVFETTEGQPPQAGIDIEPDGMRDIVEDVLIERCDFIGNTGWGLDIHLDELNHNSPKPVSLTVRNCRMRGNRLAGIRFDASAYAPAKGVVRFEDCVSSGNAGPALLLRRQYADGFDLSFKNCTFDGCGGTSVVVRVENAPLLRPFGGVSVEGVRIIADGGCEPFFFRIPDGAGVEKLSGEVEVIRGGVSTCYDAGDFAAKYPPAPVYAPFRSPIIPSSSYRLVPACPEARAKEPSCPWFYGGGTFMQYVSGPGEYPVTIRKALGGVGKSPVVRVAVTGPDGSMHDSFVARGFDDYVYPLKAKGKGLYKFTFTAYEHVVAFDSPFPGQGMLADVSARCMYSYKKKSKDFVFYFRVPSGAENVAVYLKSSGKMEAQLVAPDGTVAAQRPFGDGTSVLAARRKDKSAAETWCVKMPRVTWTFDMAIGAPCVPVTCSNPELVLENIQQ